MKQNQTIIKELLQRRGIVSDFDMEEFLSDRPQRTYDPFLLLNMKAGVDLLLSEIKAGTRICIYGDYDADGVTSICVLSSVIGALTERFTYYIPSRFTEGYGLNCEAIRRLKEEGIGLIVTVDCGSVSYEEVEYAKSIGMKMIVTDHHNIDGRKADCILINPKQQECTYPFKGLAGCGVAFKLAQAVQQTAQLPKSVLNAALDMVAVGTVADVVPLLDENRTLVKYGLNKINAGERLSLRRLIEGISLRWVNSEHIAFGIAPHINAAGRMDSALEAARLFLSEDEQTIERQVQKLICFNAQRKQKQEEAYRKCLDFISGKESFILLEMDDIHEGIAGIVAGKIKERFHRPTAIVTPSEAGYLKGTGRSIPGVDIFALLKKHEELFVRFGGHQSACGFTIAEEKLPLLREAVQAELAFLLDKNPALFQKTTEWEMKLTPAEVSVGLAKLLEQLEPFGEGNESPRFLLERVWPQSVKYMGAEQTHARFSAVDDDGSRADCVLFQTAQEHREDFCGRYPLNLIGSISLQQWRGQDRVQFVIEEIERWNEEEKNRL